MSDGGCNICINLAAVTYISQHSDVASDVGPDHGWCGVDSQVSHRRFDDNVGSGFVRQSLTVEVAREPPPLEQ